MYKNRDPINPVMVRNRLIYTLCATLWLLVSPALSVLAEDFDETIKAPEPLSGPALNHAAKNLFGRFEKDRALVSILRSSDSHAEWAELRWQISTAIDARRPLNDLQAIGLNPRGDGAYDINLAICPQWFPLEDRMQAKFSPAALDGTLVALRQRGFRDQDVEVVTAYLRSNNLQQMIVSRTAPLTTSFAARTKNRMSHQRLTNSDVSAYQYQFQRIVDDVERKWAIGLLDSLDLQRQRILTSYLLEMNAEMVMIPSNTKDQVEQVENWLLSGQYLKDIQQQTRSAEYSKAVEYR
jgi:hypothetical protein